MDLMQIFEVKLFLNIYMYIIRSALATFVNVFNEYDFQDINLAILGLYFHKWDY